MAFKKITRLAVLLCLFSAVLSVNVQHGKHERLKKSTEMEEAVMHPKKIYKQASTPPKESPRKGAPGDDDDADIGESSQMLDDNFMRRMELDDSQMHDPPKKPREMEEAVMHPQNMYKRASTPPKESPRKGAPAADDDDAGIGEISQMLDDEFMRRMELDDSDMHDPPKKPREMEEAVMHPLNMYKRASTPPKESPRKGAPAADDDDADIGEISQMLDDEFMRRMELDDSEMHDPPKIKKSARPLEGMDLDGMHPRPGVAVVQAKDAKSVDDPAIRDSDLFSVLGKDILEQFAFDDSAMHPRGAAKQPSRSSSKSRAPEMDERVMHPHAATKEQQKDTPAIEPSKEEDPDISTELGEDFLRKFELDDSLMHPAKAREEWKKSSYYIGKDKTAGLRMHPKAAPHQQQGAEDVVKDDDVDDEIDADEDLGHNFMQRKELDGSGMHDPNWQHRELDAEKFQRIRRSYSRRLDRGLGFPLHASCGLNWVFGMNCSSVSKALEQQIAKWSTKDNCDGGGEKCLYKLVSSNATTLLATHETPENHYFDDLSFQFTKGSETCKVYGFSTSQTWYAVLDKGTNYCNLHNLITGSGLNNTPGYKETTKDDICTQFSIANCDVY